MMRVIRINEVYDGRKKLSLTKNSFDPDRTNKA